MRNKPGYYLRKNSLIVVYPNLLFEIQIPKFRLFKEKIQDYRYIKIAIPFVKLKGDIYIGEL